MFTGIQKLKTSKRKGLTYDRMREDREFELAQEVRTTLRLSNAN